MNSSELSDLSAEPAALQALSRGQRERLSDLLDRYLTALERGAPLAREELLRGHPDLAGALDTYLHQLDHLHDLAAGFTPADDRRLAAAHDDPTHDDPTHDDATAGVRRIGDFRIVRELGRGGMGIVYEAVQMSLSRRVALKILPFAAVLDARQIARFKNEAQAAAQLFHPHIVPVYAVGVEAGVHYYAMKYIDGQPLDRAIADLRRRSPNYSPSRSPNRSTAPDVPADLLPHEPVATAASQMVLDTLFSRHTTDVREYVRTVARIGAQAASALHAAHEYGVVHRDVKPSNLLLDGDGNAWVTDFGLARFQADASLTRTGDVVGTVRYMSPEQASGQSGLVDARTDIYSLGATLYELLTLEPAFGGDDVQAILRRIGEHEPRRLRHVRPELPPEIETVLAKAMAKSPADRYATAQEFADDLQRIATGRPTLAQPPTLLDRAARWTRRHARAVFTSAAVCAAATIALVAATLFIAQAKQQSDANFARAERSFRDAQEAVDRFGTQLAERLVDVPGAKQVRRELLRETLAYYRRFVTQAEHDPTLRAELALTYSKIGSLAEEIGSPDEALAAHQQALTTLEQLAAEQPGATEFRRRLGLAHNNLAETLRKAGRMDDAGRRYAAALETLRPLATRDDRATGDLALVLGNHGLWLRDAGRRADAEASFREALRLQSDIAQQQGNDIAVLQRLVTTYNNLSSLYETDAPAQALPLLEQALAWQQRIVKVEPEQAAHQSELALLHNNLGSNHLRRSQTDDAAAAYGRAIDILRRLARLAPDSHAPRRDLAVSLNNLGMLQSRTREFAAAEASFREALTWQEGVVRQNPGDVDLRSSFGGIYNNLGIALEEQRRGADALAAYRTAVDHQRAAFRAAPSVERYREFLSKHLFNHGRVARLLGQTDVAIRAALERQTLWPADPQKLVGVAEELALAHKALVRPRTTTATPEISPAACAAHALAALQQAKTAGLHDTAALERDTFSSLRELATFSQLFTEPTAARRHGS